MAPQIVNNQMMSMMRYFSDAEKAGFFCIEIKGDFTKSENRDIGLGLNIRLRIRLRLRLGLV